MHIREECLFPRPCIQDSERIRVRYGRPQYSQECSPGKEEAKLTGKQLEILKMVARGIMYKEIGAALGLTERTVKYHMDRIIELLHLENRAQVIAYAARTGLIAGKGTDG